MKNKVTNVIMTDTTRSCRLPVAICFWRLNNLENPRHYRITRERIRRLMALLGDGKLDAVWIDGLDDGGFVHARCYTWAMPVRYFV